MENFNFFNVRIGTETKRNNFIENYSFISRVKSEVTFKEVATYFTNKYRGLSVRVSEIEEIHFDEITPKEERNYMGERRNEVKLRKEIEILTEKLKGEVVKIYESSIEENLWPTSVKELVSEINDFERESRIKRKEVSDLLNAHLKEINKRNCEWVSEDKGLNDNLTSYKFKMLLKGELIKKVIIE